MSDDDVYIVGAARTVFGRFDGEDNELAEQAIRGAMADAGIAWSDVEFAVLTSLLWRDQPCVRRPVAAPS